MSLFAVSSLGCRPSRIAFVMSGARKARWMKEVTYVLLSPSARAISLNPLASPRINLPNQRRASGFHQQSSRLEASSANSLYFSRESGNLGVETRSVQTAAQPTSREFSDSLPAFSYLRRRSSEFCPELAVVPSSSTPESAFPRRKPRLAQFISTGPFRGDTLPGADGTAINVAP